MPFIKDFFLQCFRFPLTTIVNRSYVKKMYCYKQEPTTLHRLNTRAFFHFMLQDGTKLL